MQIDKKFKINAGFKNKLNNKDNLSNRKQQCTDRL